MSATASRPRFTTLLAGAGTILLGLFIAGALLLLSGLFLFGTTWLGLFLFPILITASRVAFLIVLFVLLPLACFHHSRPYAGLGLFVSSYLFGAVLWVWSVLIVIALWGGGAFIFVLLFTGGTVVPAALIAAALHGEWVVASGLIFSAAGTFGARLGGGYLVEHADRPPV